MAARIAARLRSWDGLLLAVVIAVIGMNIVFVEPYLGANALQNQVNLWQSGIEKAILVLATAFVIINGEIDLSVASVMGLSAVIVAVLWEQGVGMELAIVLALLAGVAVGLFNGFWVAIVGLPSLAVTLAGLIGIRGLAFVLIEDGSIGNAETAFPVWFEDMGQQSLGEILPVLANVPILERGTFAMAVYALLLVLAAVTLSSAGFGRRNYAIGGSLQVSRYSGVGVASHKMAVMTISATTAALAGVLFASKLGAVRGSTALGFELDVITIVLLGGVSIFGGSGTMFGVFLSTVLVLNIRNGLGLQNVPGHTQTGVIGLLLILSVLLPNIFSSYQERARRRALAQGAKRAREAVAPSPD